MNTRPLVSVDYTPPGKDTVVIVHRCYTVKEAEDFIASLPDHEAVKAGCYGINAPEEMVNPPRQS